MSVIISIKKLKQLKYNFLENLPDVAVKCFGRLTVNFRMMVWGQSGNGKTSFMMHLLNWLAPHGRILYISLEEGHEFSIQKNVIENIPGIESGIEFADHRLDYEGLRKYLKKQRAPQFIVIDSVQYWKVTTEQYFSLVKEFKRKSFIFVSHADGKLPRGRVANDIRYDVGVKVRVEGFVAFITSRYGGNIPYVIWKKGATLYWGDLYDKVVRGIASQKKKKEQTEKPQSDPKPEPQPATEA